MKRVLILGAGYTGRVLLDDLRSRGYEVFYSTRRTPGTNGELSPGRFRFDLERPDTYHNIPDAEATAWLFPAEPVNLVRAFLPVLQKHTAHIVVVGSTSAYTDEHEDALLNEESALDTGSERVEAEEYLRGFGVLVLRAAGIYGPGRNPLDWLRQGRIASGRKFVNLIHVADLAESLRLGMESSCRGETIIVSDGHPRRWDDIAGWASLKGFLEPVSFRSKESTGSRRLSNQKLQILLAPRLVHQDLYAQLESMEEGAQTPSSDTSPAP